MVLLAGLQVLIARWSGQTDVIVGSPIAGRAYDQIEGLIGFFLNTLALRTDLSGDPSFRDVLRRVKETALGAYAHQDLPFEKLVAELQPQRDLSRHPLFQIVLTFGNAPRDEASLAGVKLTRLSYSNEHASPKFDLTFNVYEHPAGLRGSVEYASELFDDATVAQLVRQLERVLRGAVAAPEGAIGAIALVQADEYVEQVERWNATAAPYAAEACLHEVIAAQAARTPDAVAVVDGTGVLRYGELEAEANQLAHYLRGLGVGPDVVVGLCLARSRRLIVAMLGVLKAGGAYLPVEGEQPPERLAYG